MAEATYYDDDCEVGLVLAAAASAGEVYQMPDGRAGVCVPATGGEANDKTAFRVEGVFRVAKGSTVVIAGAPLWWDHSANVATPVPQFADRDFYLGAAQEDAASATTSVLVAINVEPRYIIDAQKDCGDTALVLTAGTPTLFNRGGGMLASFSTTAEAQKIDWLSQRTFPLGSNWVLEALVEVVTNADADVADLSIGVANGTHASDADSITESAFFHFDLGADLNIDCESDDGTTEVAATDSTVDFAVGTPVHLVLDGRDPSDVKYYINGSEVLSATANLGNIAAATGPLMALFHLEKSSNDSPGVVLVHGLKVRTAQQ